MTETPKFKLSDILYAVVIPVIVGIIIIALPSIVGPGAKHLLGEGSPIPIILTVGFAQMLVLGIPLLLGLVWNKWAGGASGFLMGSIWYLANAGTYNGDFIAAGVTQFNLYRDISFVAYIVMAILIGYMGGALNNRSLNFKRMLGASLTASIITAVFQWILNMTVSLPPLQAMAVGSPPSFDAQFTSFYLVMVPQIALAVIIPIIAKVMTWYGLAPSSHPSS